MDSLLKNLTCKKCFCYLDDVIVLGKDFETTLENLRLVFEQFRKANLKLKTKKCLLFHKKLPYLGHIISENGIACDPAKVHAIQQWPTLRSKKDVRSFLGLA